MSAPLVKAVREVLETYASPKHLAFANAMDTLRAALAEAEAPTVPVDQIAVNAWKLRMVHFDEDGHPTASRQPEPDEIQKALAEAEKAQPVTAREVAQQVFALCESIDDDPMPCGHADISDNDPGPSRHGRHQAAPARPLTDEQIAALTIMLDHYGNDPRTQCLRPLIERAHGIGGDQS